MVPGTQSPNHETEKPQKIKPSPHQKKKDSRKKQKWKNDKLTWWIHVFNPSTQMEEAGGFL